MEVLRPVHVFLNLDQVTYSVLTQHLVDQKSLPMSTPTYQRYNASRCSWWWLWAQQVSEVPSLNHKFIELYFSEWPQRTSPFMSPLPSPMHLIVTANHASYSSKMSLDMTSESSSRQLCPLTKNCMQCEAYLSLEIPSRHFCVVRGPEKN